MLKAVIAAALICAFAGAAALAGDPPPFRDFTFKRVTPPAPGQARRILVQIDPAEPPAPASAAPRTTQAAPPEDGASRDGPYGWFWARVPPSGPGAAGLGRVLDLLARPPDGATAPSFRLDRLRRIADAHGADILAATIGTRVSPALALAVIAVESGGRKGAVSPAGARGLMQLMPATARRFGVHDSHAGTENIRGGVTYLDWLLGRFGGDPVLALAGYNAGEGAVDRHSGVPPYAETRGYVPRVLAAFAVARGLCLTPPVLIGDGCVFAGARVASRG